MIIDVIASRELCGNLEARWPFGPSVMGRRPITTSVHGLFTLLVKDLSKVWLCIGPLGQAWLAVGQLLQACHKRPPIRGPFLAMTATMNIEF